MNIAIDLMREDDGRWIAECPDFAGIMVYGDTPEDAARKVILLLRGVHPEAFR